MAKSPDYLGNLDTKQDIYTVPTQTKTLSANISSGVSVVETELSFYNLEIGKKYRVTGELFQIQGPTVNINVEILNNGAIVHKMNSKDTNGQEEWMVGVAFTFTAEADSLLFEYNTTIGQIAGNGTRERTYLTIEEAPFTVETTQFDL